MVLIELIGLSCSASRVVFRTLCNSAKVASSLSAPNGTLLQKITGALFGVQHRTRMMKHEAVDILGFEKGDSFSSDNVIERMNLLLDMNALERGGSPFINDKIRAAAHILLN